MTRHRSDNLPTILDLALTLRLVRDPLAQLVLLVRLEHERVRIVRS